MCPCLHRRIQTPMWEMSAGDGGRGYDNMELTLLPAQESSIDKTFYNTTDACGWQIVSASIPGAIHVRGGASNQDALSWWSAEGERPLAVLCVADGHGGNEYTRSDIGARRAVEQAQMLLVREVLPRILDGSALMDLARFKRHFDLDQQLPKELVKRWLASIDEHAKDNPLPENTTSAQPDVPVERRYGATILAALLTPKLHLYIQLGDGDILTVSEEGEVTRPPFPVDSQLIANHTTSLCSKNAWRFVRIHFQQIDKSPPVLVLLATDGYANSFADNVAFEHVAKDIYSTIKQDGPAAVASQLPGWLAETSEAGSGDDISVIIATDVSRLK